MAINAWDVDLTYGDLDLLSSRLAHHLRSLGIGPETWVPLCFEKSGWAIVAMMAWSKPAAALCSWTRRIRWRDSTRSRRRWKPRWLLCSLACSSLWQQHPAMKHVQVVDNVSLESLPSVSGMPIVSGLTPNSGLYTIFTSGSTGKPKGCVIEHHNFLTTAKAQRVGFNMVSTSRVLSFASYSFDACVWEMMSTLTAGGCVCVPSERAKARSIIDVINDLRITWTFLTPSVAKLFRPADVPCLRTLVLGGEALTRQNVETWAEDVQLINAYGPSECTITCMGIPIPSPDSDPRNIGRGFGCRLRLQRVDRRTGQPRPPGSAGHYRRGT